VDNILVGGIERNLFSSYGSNSYLHYESAILKDEHRFRPYEQHVYKLFLTFKSENIFLYSE